MRFTDIFIRRPVLATVISLLILLLGLRSLSLLQVRQYPFTENAVVTVSTVYTGADPALVAGFITTPLENAIAQAQGIDYLTSSSLQGSSTIQANLRLNYDPNKALTEINTKVNSVINQLPKASQQPVLNIAVGETIDSMYLGFYSQQLSNSQVTDYLIRVIQPKLQAVEGVQQAEILGQRQFALRAWLDPAKLTAYGVTAFEVSNALANNNFISAVGRTQGNMVTVDLTIATDLQRVEAFENLIIKAQQGALIRLKDVATVSLGADNYNTAVKFNGQPAVYVGIKVAPTANVLSVIKQVRRAFTDLQQQLPRGLQAHIVYDESRYINSAIKEVVQSLLEALLIVTVVIFVFLGSFRSVLIPVLAMPLSLLGGFFIMLLLGFSINLLTLLALVLAIGLVVDDAIIIVENIYRYIEAGETALDAALQGTRELANPIISISVVLIAVYVPVAFMGGLTGALFTEFAFTLAGAVAISAVIALTLSPMMCSRALTQAEGHHKPHWMVYFDRQFAKLQASYEQALRAVLANLPVVIVFSAIILLSLYGLYATAKSELAPQEDQGLIVSLLTASPNATLAQTQQYSERVFKIFKQFPETEQVFQFDGVNGLNSSLGGMVFKPWNQRHRTTNQIQPKLQPLLDQVAGAKVVAFQKPPLPGGGSGLPVQFVIKTTDSYDKLNSVAEHLLQAARQSGSFIYIDSDLKIDKAQTSITLDRDKSAQLGLNMSDIGAVLASALSENYINYFNFYGRSYKVIAQVQRAQRLNADQLLNYYLPLGNGMMIPLSTLSDLKTTVVPESVNHFQQLNSATLSAVPVPGISLGSALQQLSILAKKILPEGYLIDYAAQSRQFERESSALLVTFFLALLIIFLCLAAQFESFSDPLIVLISVPLSICGALIFINLGLGGASLNIYSEVGLVTLIGLISKHGILIVQFANDLQQAGQSKLVAVQKAVEVRFRPILMTTAAMVLGVVPLLIASGAGAMSRFNIGLVIASGLSIGTLFTLFIVPAMYVLIAKDHGQRRLAA